MPDCGSFSLLDAISMPKLLLSVYQLVTVIFDLSFYFSSGQFPSRVAKSLSFSMIK